MYFRFTRAYRNVSKYHKKCARGYEDRADYRFYRKLLVQKHCRHYQGQNYAELIHRSHARRVAELQRLIIAEP